MCSISCYHICSVKLGVVSSVESRFSRGMGSLLESPKQCTGTKVYECSAVARRSSDSRFSSWWLASFSLLICSLWLLFVGSSCWERSASFLYFWWIILVDSYWHYRLANQIHSDQAFRSARWRRCLECGIINKDVWKRFLYAKGI